MNTFTISQAAKYLNRSTHTLQRWDRTGVLCPISRTATNRRVYTKNQLDEFLGFLYNKEPKRNIVYCRVSSNNQKNDLLNQKSIIEEFCVSYGILNPEFIEEIGGGLNFNRPKFLNIIESIIRYEVDKLIIAHKDRLCRFGFDLIKHIAETHGCEIVILNQEKLSPQEEMVQDLMTIVHCFSSRLYGLRNYKKEIKNILNESQSPNTTKSK